MTVIDAAMAQHDATAPGARIGLIGSAVNDAALHEVIAQCGTLVADLQPYGQTWPACHAGGPQAADLLAAVAADLRAFPPGRYRPALLHVLERCDLVVCRSSPATIASDWNCPPCAGP